MITPITDVEVARLLGISVAQTHTLVDKYVLRPVGRTSRGYLFSSLEIARLSRSKGPSLAEAAAQVGVQIQQEMLSSVTRLQVLRRRVLVGGLSMAAVGALAMAGIALLFLVSPQRTSDFFGLYYRYNIGALTTVAEVPPKGSRVLAAQTVQAAVTKTSLLADTLKPLANASLLVVKAVDGKKYEQIVTGPGPTAGTPGPAGAPGVPGAPGASGSNGIDGKDGADGQDGAPGAPGVAGADGPAGAEGPAGAAGANGTNGVDGTDGADGTSVADVTTTIGDIIIRDGSNTAARLGIGSNGQVLTVSSGLPAWQDPIGLLTESDTLDSVVLRGASTATLVTLNGGLNVAAGPLSLPNASVSIAALAAGDYSTKLTSGNYAINILGNAATATTALQFTGMMAGDVTGTQGAAVVGKINGASLGVTTPTAGNLLVGSGAAWISQTLTGDVALSNAGVTSLKNTGTAGSYGSASSVPVITTDAQGRVSGVVATTIAGLGVSNFASPVISQWSNDAGYIAAGGSLFSAAAAVGSPSAIVQGGTLTLGAGSNINTSSNGAGTITVATSATPTFTTVNGLAITANGSNSLSIAAGKSLTVGNSVAFTGTDGTSFALPVTSDDLVGRTVTQTLINKTLTAPVINGTVTTTGLTLPAFTAAGAITGSTTLTLDAAPGSAVTLGTTNATALTIGRSGVTTTIDGTTAVSALQIGGGTPILKHLSATTAFNAGALSVGCTDMATVTVTGASPGDTVAATPTPISGGAETLNMSWVAYVSSANTVTIRGCGLVIGVNPPNQTWRVDVWQH